MKENSKETSPLSRRQIVTGMGAAVAVSTLAGAARADHHEESGHSDHAMETEVPHNKALVDAALHCVQTGNDCLQHCFETFRQGDTSLALCATKVHELAVSCTALADFAAHDSVHLAAIARAAMEVCAACEEECRKHSHHKPCVVCADSCQPCIDECEKVLSA